MTHIARTNISLADIKFRVGCAISCAGVKFRTWCFLYCPALYKKIVR